MTTQTIASLSRLVDLRQREVDRLLSDMAGKQQVSARYRRNLDRLDGLCQGAGASGSASPVLSLNCGHYKQSVLQLAQAHRTELALHDADLAVAQQALAAASRRHEVLGKVLESKQIALQKSQEVLEQKRQDELASRVWFRGQM